MPAPRPIRSQHGFSIIELMVGLLVGMLAVLIVVQVLYSASTQQRLTSTSGDAEINAATATHILTRELSQAGLGISAYTLLGCSLTYTTTSDSKSVTLSSLAPVTVNPGTSLGARGRHQHRHAAGRQRQFSQPHRGGRSRGHQHRNQLHRDHPVVLRHG